jgi:hypothetical protein
MVRHWMVLHLVAMLSRQRATSKHRSVKKRANERARGRPAKTNETPVMSCVLTVLWITSELPSMSQGDQEELQVLSSYTIVSVRVCVRVLARCGCRALHLFVRLQLVEHDVPHYLRTHCAHALYTYAQTAHTHTRHLRH